MQAELIPYDFIQKKALRKITKKWKKCIHVIEKFNG